MLNGGARAREQQSAWQIWTIAPYAVRKFVSGFLISGSDSKKRFQQIQFWFIPFQNIFGCSLNCRVFWSVTIEGEIHTRRGALLAAHEANVETEHERVD